MKSLFLKLNLHRELLLMAEMGGWLGTELVWVQKDLQQPQKPGLYNTLTLSLHLSDINSLS